MDLFYSFNLPICNPFLSTEHNFCAGLIHKVDLAFHIPRWFDKMFTTILTYLFDIALS